MGTSSVCSMSLRGQHPSSGLPLALFAVVNLGRSVGPMWVMLIKSLVNHITTGKLSTSIYGKYTSVCDHASGIILDDIFCQ